MQVSLYYLHHLDLLAYHRPPLHFFVLLVLVKLPGWHLSWGARDADWTGGPQVMFMDDNSMDDEFVQAAKVEERLIESQNEEDDV